MPVIKAKKIEIAEKLTGIDSALFCLDESIPKILDNPADYACLYSHAIKSIRAEISVITETLETLG